MLCCLFHALYTFFYKVDYESFESVRMRMSHFMMPVMAS